MPVPISESVSSTEWILLHCVRGRRGPPPHRSSIPRGRPGIRSSNPETLPSSEPLQPLVMATMPEPHVCTHRCHGPSAKGIVCPRANIYMFQHGPVVLSPYIGTSDSLAPPWFYDPPAPPWSSIVSPASPWTPIIWLCLGSLILLLHLGPLTPWLYLGVQFLQLCCGPQLFQSYWGMSGPMFLAIPWPWPTLPHPDGFYHLLPP